MKIALIVDEFTGHALELESNIQVQYITPQNYKTLFKNWRPDFLFAESAWHGCQTEWKFKIASYPKKFWKNNKPLKKVIRYAKHLGIPTVFWNKEDDIHFNRFIDSARLFDHIFTVDRNCVSKYRKVVSPDVTVSTLMFAVQPKIHTFTGFDFKFNRANFVGSYDLGAHDKRRSWQDRMFQSACSSGLELTVYDRYSEHQSTSYRYPNIAGMEIKSAIPYEATAQVYKDYLVSLNVNTIENSTTMFSRRLIDIMACGGIVVTNPNRAVDTHFSEYCYIVNNREEMSALFSRLKQGPSQDDLERARAGAKFIASEHTWEHRLTEVYNIIGLL